MAKKSSLASMSVDALFKLRDDVAEILSDRARDLQSQLARLTGAAPKRGRPKSKTAKRGTRKGSKVAPKYRGPGGVTWSGRGLKPRWLTAELKKGKKLESFAIKK